jgi:hypothetical protein
MRLLRLGPSVESRDSPRFFASDVVYPGAPIWRNEPGVRQVLDIRHEGRALLGALVYCDVHQQLSTCKHGGSKGVDRNGSASFVVQGPNVLGEMLHVAAWRDAGDLLAPKYKRRPITVGHT